MSFLDTGGPGEHAPSPLRRDYEPVVSDSEDSDGHADVLEPIRLRSAALRQRIRQRLDQADPHMTRYSSASSSPTRLSSPSTEVEMEYKGASEFEENAETCSQEECRILLVHSASPNAMFRELFERSELVDFTVVCPSGQEIQCHKLVLACHSTFFRGMYQQKYIEHQENRVTLDGVPDPYSLLPKIIDSMYSGSLQYEPHMAVAVAFLGSFLGVSALHEQAVAAIDRLFFHDRLYTQFLDDAVRFGMTDLVIVLTKKIVHGFSAEFCKEEGASLPFDFVYSILSHPALNVASEVHVLRWCQDCCRNKKPGTWKSDIFPHLSPDELKEKLFSLVRYEFLPNKTLVDLSKDTGFPFPRLIIDAMRERMLLLNKSPGNMAQYMASEKARARSTYLGMDNGIPGGSISSLQALIRSRLLPEERLKVFCSGLLDCSNRRNLLLDSQFPGLVFCTDSSPEAFVEIHLPKGCGVRLSKYGFKHGGGSLYGAKRRMRCWDFWGRSSHDEPWVLLRQHRNDLTVQTAHVMYEWDLPMDQPDEAKQYFTQFKLTSGGAYPDYSRNFYLCLSCFDITGTFSILE